MQSIIRIILLSVLLSFLHYTANTWGAEETVPVEDTVTMLDFGSVTCIPCKMMAPILEELKVEYKGRAEIIFINVSKDQSQTKRFKVLVIPTQIFYDRHGEEVYRHSGFYSKEEMKRWLDMLIENS